MDNNIADEENHIQDDEPAMNNAYVEHGGAYTEDGDNGFHPSDDEGHAFDNNETPVAATAIPNVDVPTVQPEPSFDMSSFVNTQVDIYENKRQHVIRLVEWNDLMMSFFAAQRIPFIQKINYVKSRITLRNSTMLEMKTFLEYLLDMHIHSQKHTKAVKVFGSFLEESGGFPRPPQEATTDPSVLSLGALAALTHSSNQTHEIFIAKLREAINEIIALFKAYNKQRDTIVSAMERACDKCEERCKSAIVVLDEIVLSLVNHRRTLVGEKKVKYLPNLRLTNGKQANSGPVTTADMDHILQMHEELFIPLNSDDTTALTSSSAATAPNPIVSSVVAPVTQRKRVDTFSLEQKYRESILSITRAHRAMFHQCATALNLINAAEARRSAIMQRILATLTISQVQMHNNFAKMAEKCYNDVMNAPAVAHANLTQEEAYYANFTDANSRDGSSKGDSIYVDPLSAGATRDPKVLEAIALADAQAVSVSNPPPLAVEDDIFDVNMLVALDPYSQSIMNGAATLEAAPLVPVAPGPMPANYNVLLHSNAYLKGLLSKKTEGRLVLTSDHVIYFIPSVSVNQDKRMVNWVEPGALGIETSEDPRDLNTLPIKGKPFDKAITFKLDAYYTQASLIETKKGVEPGAMSLRMRAGFFDKSNQIIYFENEQLNEVWIEKINSLNFHNPAK